MTVPSNPNAPLTLWIALTFVVTVVTTGVPLLLGMLSYRRAARTGAQQDIAALVGPIIAAAIKEHNNEEYVHPAALTRYTTMESFNSEVRQLRSDISGLRSVIDANEQRRAEDVKLFRDDMRELKSNLARAIGRRVGDHTGGGEEG